MAVRLDLDEADHSIGSGFVDTSALVVAVAVENEVPLADAASTVAAGPAADPGLLRVDRLANSAIACADGIVTDRSSSSDVADDSAAGSWIEVHHCWTYCWIQSSVAAVDHCCSASAEPVESSVGSQID